jgi:hypothetical protein
MRPKNRVRTERAQLSLSDNVNRILSQLAELGILGKTKAEVGSRIVTQWIWENGDRLEREGINIRGKAKGRRRG